MGYAHKRKDLSVSTKYEPLGSLCLNTKDIRRFQNEERMMGT